MSDPTELPANEHLDLSGADVVVMDHKKKKKKYSKGGKDAQRAERGLTRASARIAHAVSLGLTDFDKRSRKSSRKRRDGAMVDSLQNAAKGSSKALKKAADAPKDLAKKLKVKRLRKPARSLLGLASADRLFR